MSETKEAQPSSSVRPVKGKKQPAATASYVPKRHQGKHKSDKSFNVKQMRRTCSKGVVTKLAWCGGAPSLEWKKDLRLHVAIEIATYLTTHLKDAALYAKYRSGGKNAILTLTDVKHAFEMPDKGRQKHVGILRRLTKKIKKKPAVEGVEVVKRVATKASRQGIEAIVEAVEKDDEVVDEATDSDAEDRIPKLLASSKRARELEESKEQIVEA